MHPLQMFIIRSKPAIRIICIWLRVYGVIVVEGVCLDPDCGVFWEEIRVYYASSRRDLSWFEKWDCGEDAETFAEYCVQKWQFVEL